MTHKEAILQSARRLCFS